MRPTVGTSGLVMRVLVAAVSLGALFALPAGATPARPTGARAIVCNPIPPSVVGGDVDRVVVKFSPCTSGSGITGYRVYSYANGQTVAGPTADVGLGHVQVEVSGLDAGSIYRFRIAARTATQTGTKSTLSGATPVPFRSVSTFAARQYDDFTGAAPTAAQKAALSSAMGALPPTLGPVDAIDALQAGPYWQVQSPVIRLFQAYFGRLPDGGGLRYWVGRSRSGMRIGAISSNFAGSSEFTNRYGKLGNRKFVELVYENVLGRPGDAAGVASWTGKLDRRAKTRGEVMVGFSESSEYRRKTAAQVDVVNVFTGMVRRLPTAAERDAWMPLARTNLIAFLLRSTEYGDRVRVEAPPSITTPDDLPQAVIGKAYEPLTLTAEFGKAPLTWKAAASSLPAGMALSKDGVLSGTPTKAGPADLGVTVTDANGSVGQADFNLVIAHYEIVTPATLPTGTLRVPYAIDFEVAGATGAWTATSSESIPSGLSFTSSHGISGIPTAAGTWRFTVEFHDSAGHWNDRAFTLTIVAPDDPLLSGPTPPAAAQGSSWPRVP